MLGLILIWLSLLAVLLIVVFDWSRKCTPLVLSYFLGLSLIHVPGLLAYIGSNLYSGWRGVTALGFKFTLIGLVAFLIGVAIQRRLRSPSKALELLSHGGSNSSLGLSGWTVWAAGLVAYFILTPLSLVVPSLTSAMASLGTLIVIGLWMELYHNNNENRLGQTLAVFGVALLLPFMTVVSGGFIGFGTYWAISVGAMFFAISKWRNWSLLVAPVLIYLGLSFFVAYMAEREDIRDLVRQQGAVSARIDRVTGIFENFELFDPNVPAHTRPLDDRLNQNWLVGAGVRRHRDGLTELAYGSTVPWWAPIPRAIWPDKPAIGGGGDIVTRYTGIRFDNHTSVGVGQVLEFYINFGMFGIMFGFVGLGVLLAWLDQHIVSAFASRDLRKLLLYSMPGLTLLQPGGNLLEIVVGTVSAFIMAHLLIVLMNFVGIPNLKQDIKNSLVPGVAQ